MAHKDDEYSDVSENIRHWQNMRFAQITVYLAIMAGLFTVLYNKDWEATSFAKIAAKLAGLYVTIMFWVMDERVVAYWRQFRSRAIELETQNRYRQYTLSPPRGVITSGNAIRVFFFLQIVYWSITIVAP